MNTILDELSYAKKLLKSGLTRFMSGKDIRILIKYYRYIGIDEDNLYEEIVKYLNKFYDDYPEPIYQNFLNTIIRTSKKYNLIISEPIPFRKNELEKIRTLKNYKLERLLFTMLILGKYDFITKNKIDEYNNYTLNLKDSTVLRLAKISKKKDEDLFRELILSGLVQHKDRGDFDVLLFDRDDDSDILFYVEDINNIWTYYKPYCEVCGVEIEKRNNRHSMCDDCWKKRKKEHTKEAMRKIRQNVIQ